MGDTLEGILLLALVATPILLFFYDSDWGQKARARLPGWRRGKPSAAFEAPQPRAQWLEVRELFFWQQPFTFAPEEGARMLAGRLQLDSDSRRLLRKLVEREGDTWFLDARGERLEAEALFAKSPWSMNGVAGTVKLLCRFLDVESGEIRLDTLETYAGESFRWMRTRQ